MRNVICLILLLAVGTSCQGQVANQLSPKSFQAQIDQEQENFVILDLRTDEEVAEGKVPGAEQLDFYGDDFDEKLKALNKETTYYIYCRSGGRSGKTLSQMKDLGFKKVYEMRGGMNAWKAKGLEIE
ncbi:rhodanese-like domain-containing protein [Reichenbachiella sp.]|uniref:rhodanese-like domain-containing protein n=1 Tax=Reichenbachiella sp. TaxID=2184521 RepID=UPI003B5B0FE5